MSAIEKIRAKFWDQMPARSVKLGSLIEEARAGKKESTEAVASLIHTAKGEAQLLSLEPCAGLLELSDRLVKATRANTYPAATLDALDDVRAALSELATQPGGGVATKRAMSTVEKALGATGGART